MSKMKARVFIMAAIVLCSVAVLYTQEEKIRIAVSPFEDGGQMAQPADKTGSSLASSIESSLMNKPSFMVRGAGAIRDYITSLEKVQGGLADPCTLKNASGKLQVDYLAVGTVSGLNEGISIDARVVDVNTWKIVFAEGMEAGSSAIAGATLADSICAKVTGKYLKDRASSSADYPTVGIHGFRDYYGNPGGTSYGGVVDEMVTSGLGTRPLISTVETKYTKNLVDEKILEMTGIIENDNSDSTFMCNEIENRIQGEIRVFPDMLCLNYRVFDTKEKRVVFMESVDISSGAALRPAARHIAKNIEDALNNRIGTLEIETIPAGAEIRIDDIPFGITGRTHQLISLDKGKHRLCAKLSAYQEYGLDIDICPRKINSIRIKLIPLNMKLVDEASWFESAGRYTEATARLDEFIRNSGDIPEANSALYRKGHIELCYLKDYVKALDSFRTLVERYPDAMTRAEGYYGLARTYLEMDNRDMARETLQFLLEHYGNTFAAESALELKDRL